MKHVLRNLSADTVRLRRPPPKVFTNELGSTVWMSGVAPCELELAKDFSRFTDPYNRPYELDRHSD